MKLFTLVQWPPLLMIISIEFTALCVFLALQLDSKELSIVYWVLTAIFSLFSVLSLTFWLGEFEVIPLSKFPKALKITFSVFLALGVVTLVILTSASLNTSSKTEIVQRENPNKTKNLRFYHNCKCGGTTIHKVSQNRWKKENEGFHKANSHGHLGDFDAKFNNLIIKHRPFYTYESLPFNENDPVFSVVRNPYDYIVSMYKYLCKSTNLKQSKHGLNFFVSLVPLMNGLIPMDLLFKSSLDSQIKKLQKREGVLCDYILRQENLNEEFNELMQKYTLPYRIEKKTRENETNNIVSKKDLNFYSKFLIRELYKQDFEFFGYAM